MLTRLQPRNDFVLVKLTTVGKSVGGVVVPDTSQEAQKWTVVSFGPDVKGLNPGDEVMIMGTIGEDIARLPRESSLFITKQANILLVISIKDVEPYPYHEEPVKA